MLHAGILDLILLENDNIDIHLHTFFCEIKEGFIMSIAWILCVAVLLVIPANMIIAGYYRQHSCNKLGAKFGYASNLALSSQQAWDYAQRACPMRYIIAGVILVLIALLMMLLALGIDAVSTCIFASVILLLELLVWGFVYISVESGLRKLLGINEEY